MLGENAFSLTLINYVMMDTFVLSSLNQWNMTDFGDQTQCSAPIFQQMEKAQAQRRLQLVASYRQSDRLTMVPCSSFHQLVVRLNQPWTSCCRTPKSKRWWLPFGVGLSRRIKVANENSSDVTAEGRQPLTDPHIPFLSTHTIHTTQPRPLFLNCASSTFG